MFPFKVALQEVELRGVGELIHTEIEVTLMTNGKLPGVVVGLIMITKMFGGVRQVNAFLNGVMMIVMILTHQGPLILQEHLY